MATKIKLLKKKTSTPEKEVFRQQMTQTGLPLWQNNSIKVIENIGSGSFGCVDLVEVIATQCKCTPQSCCYFGCNTVTFL